MNVFLVIGAAIGIATSLVSGHPVWGGLVGAVLVRMFPPSLAYAWPAGNVITGGPYRTCVSLKWIVLGLAIGLIAGFEKNPWYWGSSALLGTVLGVAVVAIDHEIMVRQCRRLRQTFLEETRGWNEPEAFRYVCAVDEKDAIKRLRLSRILCDVDEEPPGTIFMKFPPGLDRLLRQ